MWQSFKQLGAAVWQFLAACLRWFAQLVQWVSKDYRRAAVVLVVAVVFAASVDQCGRPASPIGSGYRAPTYPPPGPVVREPMPPRPTPQDYTNDPGRAIRDLEAEGY